MSFVAAGIALIVAAVSGVPGLAFLGVVLVLTGGGASFAAVFRRNERALSAYVAAFVLVGGVLFLLLHSLFISE